MTTAASAESIRLPRWYAGFSTDAANTDGGQQTSSEDVVRVGPLTVFRAGEGCEIAAFDADANAGAGVVLFDGYLFDRAALALELGLAQRNMRTADLVAAAYQRWGADLFDKLDGCYLIAVWDRASRKLIVGHDALGRHPVFYATEPGTVWFSPNVLALASCGRVSNRPNRMSLALMAFLYWPEVGETFFEQIHRVRPGHYLQATQGCAVTERKYWDVMPEDDEPWLSDDEVIEGFEPALVTAVNRCMALAPQGIMLSGGVDSVTIAAIAAEYRQGHRTPPLVAVSGRTGREVSGEERMQSRVAEVLEMPLRASTTADWTQGRDDVSLSLEVTGELPGPSRIYWVGTYMRFYRQTAGQQLNVLLTGSGGDDWLGVPDTHAADLLRRLRITELLRFIKADVVTAGASYRSSVRRLLWAGGLRPHADTLWARIAPRRKEKYHRTKWRERLPTWLCPDDQLREELVENLLRRRRPALTESGAVPRSYYRHLLRSATNSYLQYDYETGHHVETLCGLRLLSPYHDRRIVTFFNRISPNALMHGDRYKGLLRPVVAKRLPGFELENQRKEYSKDSQDYLLHDLQQSVARAWPDCGFEALGALGIVDPAGAAAMRTDIYGFSKLTRMFALMSAERWVRHHTAH